MSLGKEWSFDKRKCIVKNALLFISTNQSAHSAFVSPWNRGIVSENFQQSLMQPQLLSASPLLCLFFAHEPTVLSEQVYAIPIKNNGIKRKSYG